MTKLALAAGNSRERSLFWAVLLGASNLAGLLAGSLLYIWGGEELAPFMEYFTQASVDQRQSGVLGSIFSTAFLSALAQLTAALLMGFCAFGGPLLFLLVAMRGVSIGGICAVLYAQSGMKGVLLYTLLFWLPDMIFSLLLIVLSCSAVALSNTVAANCLGAASPGLRLKAQRLMARYLTVSVVCILPSALAGLLGRVFGPIF